MAQELDDVRQRLRTKLGVGERQLNRLIQRREGETLLPRRLAILSLAADNSVAIGRAASEDDLAQLRAVKAGTVAPAVSTAPSTPVVNRPAAGRAVAKAKEPPRARKPKRGRTVFVVHGRNEALRKSMFSFLRSLGLDPLEWRKAIEATGQGSPSVPDILDAAFKQAVAVVVLLTPDDIAMLRTPFHKPSDPSYETRLVGQARPNVLFEAGMAFGREPNSTVLVQVGEVKPFSDVGGRHVAYLSNSAESRAELVTKLKNAGCAVDDSGSDWYSEGDFTPVNAPEAEPIPTESKTPAKSSGRSNA